MPHNPFNNCGGMVTCALVKYGQPASERFAAVKDMFNQACGGQVTGFNNETYLSEKSSSDRNLALG